MTVAFTLCSNNYLAHAKTLGDSFLKHHPNSTFIIGLVDRLSSQLDYKKFERFDMIPVEEIKIPEFDDLRSKYNITELNTAVKPAYFHYIFQKYNSGKVIYIDPDILVTSRFTEVEERLDESNIIITPHILSPIDDEFAPTDYHTLRGGIFNLGFIALSNYERVKIFLDWWHARVTKYGFSKHELNMFYDQLWINYVPCFYDNYLILKHPGYNMANWNFHERYLSGNISDGFVVNEKYPLRFFHFSSYNYNQPDKLGKYANRFNFQTRPDLKNIFTEYSRKLKENEVEIIQNVEVFYFPPIPDQSQLKTIYLIRKITSRLRKTISVLFKG